MNKKNISLLYFLLFSLNGFSQIHKSTKMAGGTASISSTNIKTNSSRYTTTDLAISPVVGVMVTENIMAGAGVSFGSSRSKGKSSRSYSIGPFGRYYYPVGNKFYILGHLGLAFGSSKSEYSKSNTTIFSIGPGANYFITENLAIEGLFNINSNRESLSKLTYKYNTLSLGLQFYF